MPSTQQTAVLATACPVVLPSKRQLYETPSPRHLVNNDVRHSDLAGEPYPSSCDPRPRHVARLNHEPALRDRLKPQTASPPFLPGTGIVLLAKSDGRRSRSTTRGPCRLICFDANRRSAFEFLGSRMTSARFRDDGLF